LPVEREHGEMLNIEIETGEWKTFRTDSGRIETFGHVVEIEFADLFHMLYGPRGDAADRRVYTTD